jgi:putative ABC transport system permease protein
MTLNIKLIIRNLTNRRNHTLLNIGGLAIGIACSLVIIDRVKEELSYDKYLPDAERIYRLTFRTTNNGTTMHFARCWEKWVAKIPASFPQVQELVRLAPYRHTAIKVGEQKFYSDRVFSTDSNFFKVFNIRLKSGDAEGVLHEPHSVIISSSLANKLFGGSDPVGKTILMTGEYDEKMQPFRITGVMQDSPSNSHIHFDMLTSFVKPEEAPDWAYVYLLLRDQAGADDLLHQLPEFIKQVEPDNPGVTYKPFLQKITDIHLHSEKDREVEPNGNIASIYLYILIALILLLVSWTNYFNLNRARLLSQGKQTDIQRINGAGRLHITGQAIAESAVCSLIALVGAIFLIDMAGYLSAAMTGLRILPEGTGSLVSIWPFIILIFILTIIAGALPTIGYVTFSSVTIRKKAYIRRRIIPGLSSYGFLLSIQFFLAIVLIISALTIFRQKELIEATAFKKAGSSMLVFKRQNWEVRSKYREFRDKALQNPYVREISASLEEPTGETMDAMQVESTAIDTTHKNRALYVLSVEDNFLDFLKIPLIAGNNFSKYDSRRKGEDYILNETAVKQLGWTPEEAVGKPLKILFDTPDIFFGGTVVGVVKDFHFNTLKQEIKPYILFQKPIFYLCFMVEIDKSHGKEAVEELRGIWEQILPDYPFTYEYMEDLYNSAYHKEFNQARLTGFFSLLAIVIICMGLIAVTSLLVARRTKEIGIRKVNGASVLSIIWLLTYEFNIWLVISFFAACPVAMVLMKRWLSNFVYHVETGWLTYLVAGIIVLSITLLTVALKSFGAATVNPVEALRYD